MEEDDPPYISDKDLDLNMPTGAKKKRTPTMPQIESMEVSQIKSVGE